MVRAILVAVLLGAVAAKRPLFFNGRPPGGFVSGPLLRGSKADATLFPGQTLTTFSQKLDHFDPLDTGRWDQRVYYNPSYADKDKNSDQDLIFLMIGGEGEEPPKWSGDPNVQIMQFASLFGATVFDLEHRFFGESRPMKDMKTSSLRLLTTQQALADCAYFITSMNKKYGFKNPKWITFGGSYPGQLSAKMRSKYPELVAAAVGSSAPLHLQLDTYGYAEGIQQVLEATPITNSQGKTCPDLVREAFDQMQQLSLTAAGRKTLNEKMHLDPPFDEKTTKNDIINFFANVYGTFQGMIQYTYDGRNEVSKTQTTAAQLCRIMNQEDKNPVDNIWDLNVFASAAWGDDLTSFANNYTEMIEEFQETDWDILGEDGASNRGWTWICCNELGAFQTTDSDTVFGSVIPMGYFYQMCEDMFGPPVNASYVRDNNTLSNAYYGGDDYFDASNVILPNGMFDPWHMIGFYGTDESKNLIPLKIEGELSCAAHCSDMYPEYKGEPEALNGARQRIRDFLSSVVYDADHPKKSASSLSITVIIAGLAARFLL